MQMHSHKRLPQWFMWKFNRIMTNKNLAILVAYSSNRVIGAQGTIPWNLPSERNRFKEICNGKKIIMGRRSFEEIGKALSYCTIVVVSKTLGSVPSGCLLADSLEKAIEICGGLSPIAAPMAQKEEILVAGGEEIYRQALPYCNTIYATEILQEFEGDRFFPKLNEKAWNKTVQAEHTECGIKYQYVTYVR